MPEKFVSVNDRSLWSQSVGSDEGEAILLVSGANASALMWPDEFVELLASKGYRVIRYDHRDTGRSTFIEFDNAPYTVEDLATDAVSILDAWEVDKAHGGKGYGKLLIGKLVDYARENDLKISPLCPYVRGQINKHPELYADVVFKK